MIQCKEGLEFQPFSNPPRAKPARAFSQLLPAKPGRYIAREANIFSEAYDAGHFESALLWCGCSFLGRSRRCRMKAIVVDRI